MAVEIPHFTYPFSMGASGHANVLEQDTGDEILNCVDLIASVVQGALIDEPTFGITDPTFMIVAPTQLISSQIQDWEPRAQITVLDNSDGSDLTMENLIVQVQTGGNG